MFKRRRFPVEIILVCVRWYCKFGVSYRDVTALLSLIPTMAKQALDSGSPQNNPRVPTSEEIAEIYRHIWT